MHSEHGTVPLERCHDLDIACKLSPLQGGVIEAVTTGGRLVICSSAREPVTVAVKMLKEGHTDSEMIDFVKVINAPVYCMVEEKHGVIDVVFSCG